LHLPIIFLLDFATVTRYFLFSPPALITVQRFRLSL
jgi:hypothetical protein